MKAVKNKDIIILWIIAVLVRLQSSRHEYAPYTFCDEDLIINEISKMATSETWVTSFFLSGGLNLYVPLLGLKILGLLGIDASNLAQISRILGVVIIGSLTAVFQYLIARELFDNVIVARISAFVFIVSPATYSLSRFYYPDHWIYFFSSVVIYLGLRSLAQPKLSFSLILGLFIGLAASLKYTGLVLLMVPGLVFFFQTRSKRNSRNALLAGRLIASSILTTALTFSLINFR